jgi:L-ascorbate metabolism protein UlaG (beta-lactamase superfamily)
MTIQWLGHSCFLITTADGKKIITDPYTPGAFQGTLDYGPIHISPDIVTVSHQHADHSNIAGLPNHFRVLTKPGEHKIEGIKFTGVEGYHDVEHGALRGMNVIFVLEADGVRVCHLGDLGDVLTPEQIEKIGRVDVLLIPVGGYYTIGPDKADAVIEQLSPKVVIPMHYRTEKIGFSIGPVEDFVRGKDNVQSPGSTELDLARLPDERTIVVLEHAL